MVTRNDFERDSCCRYDHAAIEAREAPLAERPLPPERIAGVRGETYAAAATMAATDPGGSLAARFSIPRSLAARLVLGHGSVDALRAPALGDGRVRALARRVEVVEGARESVDGLRALEGA